MEYDDVYPLRVVKYDGYDVYAPHNIDKILNDFYDDYLALPSDVGKPKHFSYTNEQLEKMKEVLKKYK